MFAAEIIGNGALLKLIFCGDHWKSPRDGWTTPEPATLEVGMTEADFSNKGLQPAGAIIVAAWLSHKDKGALTSLNLSSNYLMVKGAKIIAEAIKVTNYAVAIILVPFSCLSDLSCDCCCLPISTEQWGLIGAGFKQ
jgi:hypothetical protein